MKRCSSPTVREGVRLGARPPLRSGYCPALADVLLLRPLQGWQHSDEVIFETLRVIVQQFADAFMTLRSDNQARVMLFLHAIHNLGIVVCTGVRKFLSR